MQALFKYDSYALVEKLKKSGMPEIQATAIMEVQKEAFNEAINSMLATKTDISDVKIELTNTKSELWVEISNLRTEVKIDIANLRSEVKEDLANLRSEVKEDLANLRSEVKEDIANLRSEVKEDIANLRTEVKEDIGGVKSSVRLLQWMMAFVLTGIGSLIAHAFFLQ